MTPEPEVFFPPLLAAGGSVKVTVEVDVDVDIDVAAAVVDDKNGDRDNAVIDVVALVATETSLLVNVEGTRESLFVAVVKLSLDVVELVR